MSKLINIKGKVIDLDKIENPAFKRIFKRRIGENRFLFFGGGENYHAYYTEHLDNGCAKDEHLDHYEYNDHKDLYGDSNGHRDHTDKN